MTQEKLKDHLRYDKITGDFIWIRGGQGRRRGHVAGTTQFDGYRAINICGNRYFHHRLVWLYMYGKFPEGFIDHINHNKSDNRLCNLREVSTSENAKNGGLCSNNKSGFNGVYFHKNHNKWVAEIRVNMKKFHLGCFENKIDAIKARKKANKKYHFHKNHGENPKI